jgi:hypothetical protein
MRQEKEHFPESITKSEEAVRELEAEYDKTRNLSPEEIEGQILSIPGAKEGGGLKILREKQEKEKNKKKIIH